MNVALTNMTVFFILLVCFVLTSAGVDDVEPDFPSGHGAVPLRLFARSTVKRSFSVTLKNNVKKDIENHVKTMFKTMLKTMLK
jgi:hypothetical protein